MEIKHLVNACARFAIDFKENKSPRWISMLGGSGVGKTHCGLRLWEYLKNRLDWRKSDFNHQVVYWPRFVSELKAGEAYERFRDMWRWPVLFVDDIGADRDTTGFATEQLNTLLGSRADKWTILTSNLTIQNLAEVEPRIADRCIRTPNIFIEVKTVSHALR